MMAEEFQDKVIRMLDVLATEVASHATRFDMIDKRFDAVDERFDRLERRFDRLESRVEGAETELRDFRGDFNRRVGALSNAIVGDVEETKSCEPRTA